MHRSGTGGCGGASCFSVKGRGVCSLVCFCCARQGDVALARGRARAWVWFVSFSVGRDWGDVARDVEVRTDRWTDGPTGGRTKPPEADP